MGRLICSSTPSYMILFLRFKAYKGFQFLLSDEDAFLNFAFCFVVATLVDAFILSRYITIKPQFM